MEGHLAKHILPKFGEWAVDAIDETHVQEFVAKLKRTVFQRHRANGTLIRTYRLSRKTVLNIVGVLKLVLGRKAWIAWDLDLGKPNRPKQPYFTQEQLRQTSTQRRGSIGCSLRCWPEPGCVSERRPDSTSRTSI
jgi:hypothetical protein